MADILDILKDSLIDTAKLIPFLFATYLLMEFIEHKTSEKSRAAIGRAGKFGPVIGGILFGQDNHRRHAHCGFSLDFG